MTQIPTQRDAKAALRARIRAARRAAPRDADRGEAVSAAFLAEPRVAAVIERARTRPGTHRAAGYVSTSDEPPTQALRQVLAAAGLEVWLPVAAGGGTNVLPLAAREVTTASAAAGPAHGLGAGCAFRSGRMLANMPRARLRPVIAPAASTAGTRGPGVVLSAAASGIGGGGPSAGAGGGAAAKGASAAEGGAAANGVEAAVAAVVTAAAAA